MIAHSVIDKVRLHADIKSVVGGSCQLQGSGNRLKACCPFHAERTPSFTVNLSTNLWHCFGCGEGGDSISFVMKRDGVDFQTAVRTLAAQFGVPVEEEEDKRTSEQREQDLKHEALLSLYAVVQKYYVQNLYADTPKAQAARSYAEKRWGADFCKEFGIGYAPDGWQGLVAYAKQKSLSLDLMKEVGLRATSDKTHKDYDFFRDRVMIPIRDKFGRIIAYSARTLSEDKKVPKYINSPTSSLYKKERSIFGIDVAGRAAAKEGQFVLVEGAPDVMRLQTIGITQAVACMGSDWTEEQFTALGKLARTLLFVPDIDPPKEGQAFGTGIQKVLKFGINALKQGFSVLVKEIPNGDGKTKNDAGSYCKTKDIYDKIATEDFIIWYADKHNAHPEAFKTPLVDDVAELLALIEQEYEIDRLINLLQDIVKGKSMWKKAVLEAKRRHGEAALKSDSKNLLNIDLLEKFGFQEKNNSYISISANARTVRWSNFVLHPLFHIRDNQSALRLFEMINEDDEKTIVEFKQEDLVSLSKFKQKVESLGNYVWLVKEENLTRLKQYLYKTTETADLITQLGWQRKGFYAYGNGIYDGSQWLPVDDFGIVRLGEKGNYYLPAFSSIYRDDISLFQFERSFVHRNWGKISLHDYVRMLIDVFGDNAKVGFCFLLATLFRDVVTAKTKSFPILNLFGPKGSGKSELGHSLMAFFIIENTPPNIQNSTLPALADAVAQCANALVHIDEFKDTIDVDKREFLKGLWDGAGRNRMNMDKDKKREITRVDCGVILSGQEMATSDIALFSRFIYLRYNKTEFSQTAKERYYALKDVRKLGCSHLTLEIIRYRTQFEANFPAAFAAAFKDVQELLGDAVVEDRILLNWVIPLAAFGCLEHHIDVPFKYKELCNIIKEGILVQNREAKQNNEVANFWNIVSFLRQEGQVVINSDYRIAYEDTLKVDEASSKMEFRPAKPVLYLRYKRIFQLYLMHGRKVDKSLLPEGSLDYYLRSSHEYLGKKKSYRFRNIIQGKQSLRYKLVDGRETAIEESVVDQAYCFDYDKIKDKYDINLEIAKDEDETPENAPPDTDSSEPAQSSIDFTR